jgi:hypothetical protein
MFGELRQRDFGRRVVEDVIFLREPLEERLQGGKTAELGAQGHRPAIGLAVVEQMPLIALQDRLGDVFGISERSLLAPRNEPPQRGPARPDRVLGVARDGHPFEVSGEVGGER